MPQNEALAFLCAQSFLFVPRIQPFTHNFKVLINFKNKFKKLTFILAIEMVRAH